MNSLAQAFRHQLDISQPPTPDPTKSRDPTQNSPKLISDALNQLAVANEPHFGQTAHLAALAAPCFFHRRFEDAVDIERVLEEIAGDDSMSHSRFVQTATGVREVSKQLQRRPIKRAVRTVMIVTKARDNNLVYLTRELAEWLLKTPRYGSHLGVTVYVDEKLRNSKRFDAAGLIAQERRFDKMLQYWTPDLCWNSPGKFDLVLTLGGDGTVLFTSWLFQRIVPPILSFSLGSLGFLTPFDFGHYPDHLNKVMGGLSSDTKLTPSSSNLSSSPSSPALAAEPITDCSGMRVSLRMRFTCTVHRASSSSRKKSLNSTATTAPSTPTSSSSPPSAELATQFEVLNELVIDRGPSPYVSNLELYGDGQLLTVIQADGVIFSTPTGSTAYSLSAGGSLVHPDIPAILLTPICPHTLSFRPMLLNDTIALAIAVPRTSRATAYCSFDGKGRIELRQGDFVRISASRYPFPTVVGGRMEWMDSVSRTLRWNTRGARQKGWGRRGVRRGFGSEPDMAKLHLGASMTPVEGEEEEAEREDVLRRMREEEERDEEEGEDGDEDEEEFDIPVVGEDEEEDTGAKDSTYYSETASNASNGGGSGASPSRRPNSLRGFQ